MSALDQLKSMTQVVADTGDFEAIEKYRPQDATTNPSLITAAAQMPQYQGVVEDALRQALQLPASTSPKERLQWAMEFLFVLFGIKILHVIPGRVSTEVDARLSYDTANTVATARRLIQLYESRGVSRERVLIKIASTWEGIQAARELELEGIHCNLTLLFNLGQAIACADAKVTLISPFVGRILDWYKQDTGRASYPAPEDPGVISVTSIYHYFKKFGIKTAIMGASFRNLGEILELAGCDLLTISPALLTELQNSNEVLVRKLDASVSASLPLEPLAMGEAAFAQSLAGDRMASEKLKEGILGFTKALESLEGILQKKMDSMALESKRAGVTYCPEVRCAELQPCSTHESKEGVSSPSKGEAASESKEARNQEARRKLEGLKEELRQSSLEMSSLQDQLLAFQTSAQHEIQEFVATIGTVLQEQARGTPVKEIKAKLSALADRAILNAEEAAPAAKQP